MTEREYVEFLRQRASSYVDTLANGGGETKPSIKTVEAWNSWDNARGQISPFTLISMCEAWLDRDAGRASSVTDTGSSVFPPTSTQHLTGRITKIGRGDI